MPDDIAESKAATPEAHCPWCSAVIAVGAAVCPSCKASLVSSAEAVVPGLTSIDTDAVLRSRRPGPKPRGGLLGWISGESAADNTPSASEMSSLAPPPTEVRIEMLRLELEAEIQRKEAEAASLAAEESAAAADAEESYAAAEPAPAPQPEPASAPEPPAPEGPAAPA